jgi:hypothetical protein
MASRLREDFEMLRGALERRRGEWEGQVRAYVTAHPVATLAGAFGVGYVLGGGLLSRRTLPVLGLAMRATAGELLGRLLLGPQEEQVVPS